MRRTSESGLFELLEKLLREAKKPMTCVEIFDKQEVKDLTSNVNRVSDYLGGLWRKGKATRSIAPKSDNDSSRWAYSWRHDMQENKPRTGDVIQMAYQGAPNRTLLNRPNINITEDGDSVTIALADFTITVKMNPK